MKLFMFKRKFKKEYKKAINYKIAHPEENVSCPKCGKPLLYFPIVNAAMVMCPSRKCITGDSRGNYKFR